MLRKGIASYWPTRTDFTAPWSQWISSSGRVAPKMHVLRSLRARTPDQPLNKPRLLHSLMIIRARSTWCGGRASVNFALILSDMVIAFSSSISSAAMVVVCGRNKVLRVMSNLFVETAMLSPHAICRQEEKKWVAKMAAATSVTPRRSELMMAAVVLSELMIIQVYSKRSLAKRALHSSAMSQGWAKAVSIEGRKLASGCMSHATKQATPFK